MSFSSTNINAHNNNDNDNMANSSLDFVSADVNEVLQEARQILTDQEPRHNGEHPNELGESTTMQVTKQDSDEDQTEVAVLRKRLVKLDDEEPQEEAEDRGGLSFFCCLILKFV
jgi:hypothetical protein